MTAVAVKTAQASRKSFKAMHGAMERLRRRWSNRGADRSERARSRRFYVRKADGAR
jgi:hypothetical protein